MIIQKLPKKKTVTVGKMKKKAWEQFSIFIRTRGMVNGENQCVTCLTWKPYKELQAGHWIPGRHNSVLFDERNCHPQCYHCNVGLKGNPLLYYHFMEKRYTKRVRDELEALDKVNKQFKVYELEAIFEAYRDLNRQLLEEKSYSQW